jgi:hypothetical protein
MRHQAVDLSLEFTNISINCMHNTAVSECLITLQEPASAPTWLEAVAAQQPSCTAGRGQLTSTLLCSSIPTCSELNCGLPVVGPIAFSLSVSVAGGQNQTSWLVHHSRKCLSIGTHQQSSRADIPVNVPVEAVVAGQLPLQGK